jgi:hypothetical protein
LVLSEAPFLVLPQPRGYVYSSGKKMDLEKKRPVGMEGDKEL